MGKGVKDEGLEGVLLSRRRGEWGIERGWEGKLRTYIEVADGKGDIVLVLALRGDPHRVRLHESMDANVFF